MGGGGGAVDQARHQRQSRVQGSGNLSYYLYDGNMSTRLLVDGTGSVQNSYRYDAFGNLLASTGTVPNPFLYDGQQFDAGVGLYYLRARYLDPTQGRFLSEDPMGPTLTDPLSLHRYLYALDNPISYVDPSGADATLGDTMAAVYLQATIITIGFVNRYGATLSTGANLLTAGAKLNSLIKAWGKVNAAGNATVAENVALIYGAPDVTTTLQTATKLTACKFKFGKDTIGALAQGFWDLACSRASAGMLPGIIDFNDASMATGLNIIAWEVIEMYQALSIEWVNQLPEFGNYQSTFFTSQTERVGAIALGVKLKDFQLTVVKSFGGLAVDELSSGLKAFATVGAMILAEQSFISLIVATAGDTIRSHG